MKIKVKTLRPSEHELDVQSDIKVEDLKERLVEVTGVLQERQRLLYAGRALQDGQTLAQYGIEDGHVLHLVERPAGAGNAPSPAGDQQQQGQQQPAGGGGAAGADPMAGLGGLPNFLSSIFGAAMGGMNGGAGGQFPVTVRFAGQTGEAAAVNSVGQQQQNAAGQQQQPAEALLHVIQRYIEHLRDDPDTNEPVMLPSVHYVLPEARRLDSERRWNSAAQEVLEGVWLPPDVRRFVETSVMASLAAAPGQAPGQNAAGSELPFDNRRQVPVPQQQPQPQRATQQQRAQQQQASSQQQAQHDPHVASVVALALGYMLRQTRQLVDDRLHQTLQQSADSLLALSAPPPSDHPAVAAVQLAGSELYRFAALAWELSRLCSMVGPALSGTAQLPMANGRPGFISADGISPILPYSPQVPPGRPGPGFSMADGTGGAGGERNTVTVRLPNGARATGHFVEGGVPSQAEFMQQLSIILAGQFGLPHLGGTGAAGPAQAAHAVPPTPAGRGAGAPGRAAARGRGDSAARRQGPGRPLEGGRAIGRQEQAAGGAGGAGISTPPAAPSQPHPAVRRGAAAAAAAADQDDEMPDLVPDDDDDTDEDLPPLDGAGSETGESEDSEWETSEESNDDGRPADSAGGGGPAQRPGSAEQGTQTGALPAVFGVPGGPTITISFGPGGAQPVDLADMFPVGGSGSGGGGGLWQQPHQHGLAAADLNPAGVGAAGGSQDAVAGAAAAAAGQLRGLLSELVMPVISALIHNPQGLDPAMPDFAQRLGERIASSLQPSLAMVQSLLQLLVPQGLLPTDAAGAAPTASGAAPAGASSRAGNTGAQAAADGQDIPVPAAAAAAGSARTPGGGDQQQWAYVPTTTVEAQIVVETVDEQGRPITALQVPVSGGGPSGAAAGPPVAVQLPGYMAALANLQQATILGGPPPQGGRAQPQGAASQPSAATSQRSTTAAREAAEPAAGPAGRAVSQAAPPASSPAAESAAAPALTPAASNRGTAAPAPAPSSSGLGLASAAGAAAAGRGGGSGGGPSLPSLPPRRSRAAATRPQQSGSGGAGAAGADSRSASQSAGTGAPGGVDTSQRGASHPPTPQPPASGGAASNQLGNMIASMMGGAGGGGVSGGGFAQMLQQMTSSPDGAPPGVGGGGGGGLTQMLQQMSSSPAVQQLASSPAVQNAMQPLLGGSSEGGTRGGGGSSGGGQVDFAALMNQMGPVVAQMLSGGGAGGGAALGSAAGTRPGGGAAGPLMPNSAAAGGNSAGDNGADVPVAPDVENAIRLELSEADAARWLDALRQDAPSVQASDLQQPLSAAYAAGSQHPPHPNTQAPL